MQVQAMIEAAAPRATQSGTIYDVTLAGQTYSTFDPGVYRIAAERLGQMVTAEVEVKPSKNGQFTNYFFNGIVGVEVPQQPQQPMAGQVAMVPQPIAQGAPGVPAVQAVQQPVQMQPQQPPTQYQREMSPESIARITKLSVLQTAAHVVGHVYDGAGPDLLEEAEQKMSEMAKRLYVSVLGAPQTLDDEIVEALVQPEQPKQGEIEDWG